MRKPQLTEEMKDAGMFWQRGKKHWHLIHQGTRVTVVSQGKQDERSRNTDLTRSLVRRRLRETGGK